MRVSVYYDALLIGVLAASEDSERLVVEYNGQEFSLPVDPLYAQKLQKRLHADEISGRMGAARLIAGKADGRPVRYCFDIYPDQSLRRAPELDVFEYHPQGYNTNCIG